MISEESCDMENWSNNAENSALQKNEITQINNLPVHSTQKQAGKGWPPHTDQDTAVY